MNRNKQATRIAAPDKPVAAVTKQVRDLQARLKSLEDSHPVAGRPHGLIAARLRLPKLRARKRGARKGHAIRKGARPVLFDQVFQGLDILGFNNNLVIPMFNMANAFNFASTDLSVETPPGTSHVLAFLQGWLLGYGELSEDASTFFPDDDHHLQLAAAFVDVTEVLDDSATITATMILRDSGGDKPWTGAVVADLLFLGVIEF